MAHIVGCVEAHELTTCKVGANQHAHHILRKSMTPKGDPKPQDQPAVAETEKTMNVAEIHKAAANLSLKLAKLSDVAKKHVFSLSDDDAHKLVVEKSVDEIEEIAKAADEAAKKKAEEEEALKAGASATEQELRKSNQALQQQIDALKAKDAEREIEKRATEEFAFYPGGTVEAVKRLKSIAKLPEDERKPLEDAMKALCAQAQEATKAMGGRTEADVSKADQAKARIEKAVDEYVAEHKVEKSVAFEAVIEMAKFADDVAVAYPS